MVTVMNARVMSQIAARRTVLVHSIIAVVFGVMLLMFPIAMSRSIILILSIYLIADGVTTLVSNPREGPRGSVFLGVVSTLSGLIALANPRLLGGPLIFVFALLALVHGIMGLGNAISARSDRRLALWFAVSGAVALGFAGWVFTHNVTGPNLVRWVGIFGVGYGYALLGLNHELGRAYGQMKSLDAAKVEAAQTPKAA